MPETSKYDYLWPIATERRREYIQALRKTGDNFAAAERLLGVSKGLIAREIGRLEERGSLAGLWPDWGLQNAIPDGYDLDRVTLTMKLPNGERAWLKPKRRKEESPVNHVKRLAEELREQFADGIGLFALADPTPPTPSEYLVVDYEFGDPHFGMYADKEIVGEHFDTDRATKLSVAAIQKMAAAAPNARVAKLTLVGDNTHASDKTNSTRQSCHPLDVDPRGHSHSLMACARFCIYAVRLLLEKHETVIADILPGNHDEDAAFALAAIVAMAFEGNPRVQCEVSERRIRMHEFGNVGIVTAHGDKVKMKDLPKLVAVDFRQAWGRIENWYVITGHIHHEQWLEEMQTLVRSLSTLAGKDRWHSEAGYRALQKTGYTVYDTRYGMDSHHPLGIVRIEEEV